MEYGACMYSTTITLRGKSDKQHSHLYLAASKHSTQTIKLIKLLATSIYVLYLLKTHVAAAFHLCRTAPTPHLSFE